MAFRFTAWYSEYMQIIFTILSAIAGYLSFEFTSKPGSRIYGKVPQIKLKNIQLMPNVKIIIKGRVIHLHHWLQFTILLCISIFVTGGILDSWLTRGFLFGGIVQGLKFPDRGIFKKIQ